MHIMLMGKRCEPQNFDQVMATPREEVYRVLAEVEPCGVCGRETEFTDLVVWAENASHVGVEKMYSAQELKKLNGKSKFSDLSKYSLRCTRCSDEMNGWGLSYDYLKTRAE